MFKKIIIFLTSILLIINSTLSNAFAIRQWTVSNPMAVGASMLYDGSKGAVTSAALITPNATQVAKVLRGGGAGYALSFAVEQLLGAVDWVMDPANNQIVYYEKPEIPNIPYLYGSISYTVSYKYSKKEACIKIGEVIAKRTGLTDVSFNSINADGNCVLNYAGTVTYASVEAIINPNYNPDEQPKEKTLPLETVAQKVIENAESNNLDAQFAVLAAANNILSEAENDDAKAKLIEDELENNAKCPSGIVRNGSCWICNKSQFMPITRATRDAKTATRGKSCKNVTDTAIKTANATLFRNLINARIQENACWSPPDPNHAIALLDAQNALSLCEN